jgi:hypothetical protein
MTQTGAPGDELTALHEAPVGSAVEVDVPRQVILAVDGEGHPGSTAFRQGVRDLWRVAYAVRSLAARQGLPGHDFAMPPTEVDFATSDRSGPWRMFLAQPELLSDGLIAETYAELVAGDKPVDNSVFRAVRDPEHAVQTTHIGVSARLPGSLEVIRRYADDHGLVLGPRQHEIFVDDPIRVGFEVARDVVRCTVVDASARPADPRSDAGG